MIHERFCEKLHNRKKFGLPREVLPKKKPVTVDPTTCERYAKTHGWANCKKRHWHDMICRQCRKLSIENK
jgi:hypothetical protein